MILLCTADERLAKAMASTMGSRLQTVPVESHQQRTYHERCVALAEATRPSAIFVDVRSGFSTVRMLELARWLQRASPLSAIVIMTVSPGDDEVAEIEEAGAYTFLDLARKDLPEQIRRAVASVEKARAEGARLGIRRRGRREGKRRAPVH